MQYLKGGLFAVTPTILILDLLVRRIPSSIITGVIMLHASKVIPMGPENFLFKIIRKENPTAFIKVLSDSASHLIGMKDKCREIMKICFVDQLSILARESPDVAISLQADIKYQIYEYEISMNKRMRIIHHNLVALIETCLAVLKVEMQRFRFNDKLFSLSKAFEEKYERSIHHEIGKYINMLGPKSKQMIIDIGDLKALLYRLNNSCGVSFLTLWMEKRTQNKEDTILKYQNHEVLEKITEIDVLAKERVFTICRKAIDHDEIMECLSDEDLNDEVEIIAAPTKKEKIKVQLRNTDEESTELVDPLEPWSLESIEKFNKESNGYWQYYKKSFLRVNYFLKELEEDFTVNITGEYTPKWQTVVKILQKINKQAEAEYREIFDDSKQKNVYRPGKKPSEKIFHKRRIMIVVKTEKFKRDLERYLASYFLKKDQGKSVLELNFKNLLNGAKDKREEFLTIPNQADRKVKLENYLLHKCWILLTQKFNCYFSNLSEKVFRWRRRREKELDEETMTMDKEECKAAMEEFRAICAGSKNPKAMTDVAITAIDQKSFRYDRLFPKLIIEVAFNMRHTEFDLFATNFKPHDIILFEPSLELLRGAEAYSSRHFDKKTRIPISIHQLFLKDSSEKFVFLNETQKENRSLKELLLLSKSKKGFPSPDPFEEDKKIIKEIQRNNRKRYGISEIKYPKEDSIETWYSRKQILGVDMREFWSQNPHYLYLAGFLVIPMQLQVGDYILSNEIAIERKSVSTGDFESSLCHGRRLLDQIKNMDRFFKTPILMIEFDESIPFTLRERDLESIQENDIAPSSIMVKLAILTLSFPRMLLLWSQDSRHTTEIFLNIKKTCGDPDLDRLSKVGKMKKGQGINEEDDTLDIISSKKSHDDGKSMPYELLSTLPGIYFDNVNKIASKVESLEDLCYRTKDEIADWIGDRNAERLHSFLHMNFNELNEDLT
ncbi:unnamed protein product [Moneuplotes crassus]|uniref:ERCC4 domain-containing protein n=1 Tax=Euplotes crassus TaxID=5936 RepID=A0AAD1XXD5_EUPCR|nr:unnamed protein product [Moneuplotes crassus]